MELPVEFLDRMKAQLGDEYPAFLAGYQGPVARGARRNPIKCSQETLTASVPFALLPTSFSPLSFRVDWEGGFGSLPAHHAGMFYSQEPSAASAVTALDPQPGERVLDLCASPGGKSTQIAGLLMGQGLLWSNEPVRNRTGQLLSNLERLGVANAVVSSSYPESLCPALAGYFHRVLVDAPCSGEGLFHRLPQAAQQWSPQGVEACARRQLGILDCAAQAVKEDGVLVYSTCTFSQEENEGVVERFLLAHREFVPERIPADFGRPDRNGGLARRIYPMDGGEGHFVARFRRVKESPCHTVDCALPRPGQAEREGEQLYRGLFTGEPPRLLAEKDRLLMRPEGLPELRGLGVLRAGVELAVIRPKRLEPAHGAFMSRGMAECRKYINFTPQSPALAAFLLGQEIPCEEKGYTAVCVNGVTVGFGKASGGRLKNHYPKGLRNLR